MKDDIKPAYSRTLISSSMQPRYYAPNRPVRYQQPIVEKRRQPRVMLRALCFVVIIFTAFLVLHLLSPQKGEAQQEQVAAKPAQPTAQQLQALSTMGDQVNAIIAANSTIDIAVSAIDLHNGQIRKYGVDVPFEGASIGKLITASYFLHQIESGSESFSRTLEDGNTARYDLQQMIVVSDDNAWLALNDELGHTNLNNYAASIGITDYNSRVNNLKSEDIAHLLEKLYTGSLVNKANKSLLLGYMKQANYRDYIIPVVPADATVYHKVGILEDRVHDAAIIDNGADPIVLVVFTNGHGAYDATGRQQTIQSITQAVLTGYGIK